MKLILMGLLSWAIFVIPSMAKCDQYEPQRVSFYHPKTFHGKALFKYPNDKPVYIVTYTYEDLMKARALRMAKSLGQ